MSFIKQNFKWNSRMYVLDGFFATLYSDLTITYLLLFLNWVWAGFKSTDPSQVSSSILGYYQAIQSFGLIIPFIIVIIISEDLPLKKTIIGWMGAVQRLILFVFMFAAWLLPPVPRFYIVFTAAFIMALSGIDLIPWRIMIAKVIPVDQRGKVDAWRNFAMRLGGLLGLGLAIAIFNPNNTSSINRLMAYLPGLHTAEQARYTLLFFTTGFFGIISYVFVMLTREPREEIERIHWKEHILTKLVQLKNIIAKNIEFRHFLIFLMITGFAQLMMLGYSAIYIKKYLGLSEAFWGELNIIAMLVGIGAMFRWGRSGDSFGWRKVIIKLAFYTISIPAIMIVLSYFNLLPFHQAMLRFSEIYSSLIASPAVLIKLLLCIAFGFSGMLLPAIFMAQSNFALEFDHSKLKTSYFGLMALTLQVATAFGGLFTGFLIDRVGIPAVMLCGILIQSIAIIFALKYLREQRNLAGELKKV